MRRLHLHLRSLVSLNTDTSKLGVRPALMKQVVACVDTVVFRKMESFFDTGESVEVRTRRLVVVSHFRRVVWSRVSH